MKNLITKIGLLFPVSFLISIIYLGIMYGIIYFILSFVNGELIDIKFEYVKIYIIYSILSSFYLLFKFIK